VSGGATVVLNISASPYHWGKGISREEMLRTRARDGLCFVAVRQSDDFVPRAVEVTLEMVDRTGQPLGDREREGELPTHRRTWEILTGRAPGAADVASAARILHASDTREPC
jgi:hypothetical protein